MEKKKVLAKWVFFTSKDVNFCQKVVNHWERSRWRNWIKHFQFQKSLLIVSPSRKFSSELSLWNPQVIKPWAVHCRQSKWELFQKQTCRARIVKAKKKKNLFHFEILAGRRNLRCYLRQEFLKCYNLSLCNSSLNLEARNCFIFRGRALLNTNLELGRWGTDLWSATDNLYTLVQMF